MIDGFDLSPYRLDLQRPWASARGGFGARDGWLVRVAAAGLIGFGDCAPLPAAGTETPAQAAGWLSRARPEVMGHRVEAALAWVDQDEVPAPAARYALECALLDLLTQRLGQPLRHWLAPAALDRVPVNAMLGPLGEVTSDQAQAACGDGFRVLKLKVGLDPPDSELPRLKTLAAALPPGVALRLDANGAWDMATAVRVITALNALPIEALEEPLRHPRGSDLRELQSLARFPLALDESLHRAESAAELAGGLAGDPADLPVRRLVLKPAAVGGLRTTLAYAQRAIAAGLEVVITSLIESAAGLWPTLQLAAALPDQPPHGLATATWLTRDLGKAPVAERGHILLPRYPGGGFRVTP